jgi:hypothetical protein
VEPPDFFGVDQAASVYQHKIIWEFFHQTSKRGGTTKNFSVLHMTAHQGPIHRDIQQFADPNPNDFPFVFDGYVFDLHS